MKNHHIEKIYNGREIIINAGFTMQSNYIVPLLSRMVDEGLLNQAGYTLVQAILSYKHTEENPFPSREELARLLGKSLEYVKKGLKAIKQAGIILIEKVGRRNTYNFKPFFTLLEKFIIEFKEKKNYDVKISELLNIKVEKKVEKTEEKDFSWAEQYKDNQKEAVPSEPVQEVEPVKEEVKEVGSTLPEELKKVLTVHGVDSEGVKAVEIAYNEYKDKLEVAVFAEKIIASVGKKDFSSYFNVCITNAYINGEKPKQVYTQNEYTPNGRITIRKEAEPDWMKGFFKERFGEEKETSSEEVNNEYKTIEDEEVKNEYKTIEEVIANSTMEELYERKERYEKLIKSKLLCKNPSLHRNINLVEEKIKNPELTAEELKTMFLDLKIN